MGISIIMWVILSQMRDINGNAMRKCYGELGCLSLEGAFSDPRTLRVGPMLVLPWTRDKIRTRFHIFTRRNPDIADSILYSELNNATLRKTHFDPTKRTVIATHGYLQYITLTSDFNFKPMKDNALKSFDVNFVLMDWSRGSLTMFPQAASNTRVAGAEMALFIKKVMATYSYSEEMFHIIGHSLGGHVVGYCGKRVPGIRRITSLDPGEPLFFHAAKEMRIDIEDAIFVEVVHTDITLFFASGKTGFGLPQPLGHIDFYPNGGSHHHFCHGTKGWQFAKDNGANLPYRVHTQVACDHMYAIHIIGFLTFAPPNVTLVEARCLPVFYNCSSWNEYKAGSCADCGDDLSKCAIFGMRSREYFEMFRPKEPKMKLYAWTDMEPPVCMHNYEMNLTFGAQTNVEQIQLFLQLEDTQGFLSEKRCIGSNHDETLRLHNRTSNLLHAVIPFRSERRYHTLKTIRAEWINFSKTKADTFVLTKVDLFYMNQIIKPSEKAGMILHFCAPEKSPMRPYTSYALVPC